MQVGTVQRSAVVTSTQQGCCTSVLYGGGWMVGEPKVLLGVRNGVKDHRAAVRYVLIAMTRRGGEVHW